MPLPRSLLLCAAALTALLSGGAAAQEREWTRSGALRAYERAKEMDSVVRLNLRYLDNPMKAFAIVRKTRSSEGASMVAAYCTDNGDFQSAIEFLLFAKRLQQAGYAALLAKEFYAQRLKRRQILGCAYAFTCFASNLLDIGHG